MCVLEDNEIHISTHIGEDVHSIGSGCVKNILNVAGGSSIVTSSQVLSPPKA